MALAALGIAMAKRKTAAPDVGDEPDSDQLPGDDEPETGMPPAWHPEDEPHGGTPLEDWDVPEEATLITQETYRGSEHEAFYRIYQGPQGGYWYAWRSDSYSPNIFTGGPFADRDEVEKSAIQSLRDAIGAQGALGGVRN